MVVFANEKENGGGKTSMKDAISSTAKGGRNYLERAGNQGTQLGVKRCISSPLFHNQL